MVMSRAKEKKKVIECTALLEVIFKIYLKSLEDNTLLNCNAIFHHNISHLKNSLVKTLLTLQIVSSPKQLVSVMFCDSIVSF
uniref:Uncharacterized protein n=1 Tax=Octopus bimaculoides TaxID=37653 RepID=A0A0L8GUF5_OCTBM